MTETFGYGTSIELDVPFEEARERVTVALEEEGFGVLTEIDVQETLKEKLDAEFRKYTVLGACNPMLSYRALLTEPHIGLLLPCNVIVYEQGCGSVVGIVDPLSMLGIVCSSGLEQVAQDAKVRLDRVLTALNGGRQRESE